MTAVSMVNPEMKDALLTIVVRSSTFIQDVIRSRHACYNELRGNTTPTLGWRSIRCTNRTLPHKHSIFHEVVGELGVAAHLPSDTKLDRRH